jgi:AcrR family transcriptional regulator
VDLRYTPLAKTLPRMPDVTRSKTAAELFGVFQVPARGRGRLVATAVELFYRHGFNAIGIDRVIAEAGVTKTTFYKHFESKTDLMVAAVALRDAWEVGAWQHAARALAGDDPRAQLVALFDVLDVWFNDTAFGGCMFLNAASEFPNPHDPVHRAAAKHKRANWSWVRGLAERAGASDPDGFADLYMMTFEGALVLRQVYDRDDAAERARPLVERLIADSISSASSSVSVPPPPPRRTKR